MQMKAFLYAYHQEEIFTVEKQVDNLSNFTYNVFRGD